MNSQSTPSKNTESSDNENLLEQVEALAGEVRANERNVQIQRAVFDIAKTSSTAETMEFFYEEIHRIVGQLTSIDALIICLHHESEQCLSFPYYVDHFDDVQQEENSPLKFRGMIPIEQLKSLYTWKVVSTNDVVRINKDRNPEIAPFGKAPADWLGIPLRRDGKPIGAFAIQSYESGFSYSDEEIDLMVFIASHIGSALTSLRDRESLRQANKQLVEEIAERERINERLVQLSHQAGKAEIATGVLHNVGNVLNSINVSANLIGELLRSQRIGSLRNVTSLLDEQDDLGDFFSNDQRGAALPGYISQLTEVLDGERNDALHELETLSLHLEHVKTVVSMQQSNAGVSGIQESVAIPSLFADAKLLMMSSLSKHNVNVIKEFEDLPNVMLEKQRLLQVIVNLLKNAKDSMTSGRAEGRQLIIRVFRDESTLQMDFVDNGEGIAKRHLTDIFSHGFTTKSNGHGFGLHSCANAMREMNGQLIASSDGAGKGATFTLRMPYLPSEEKK